MEPEQTHPSSEPEKEVPEEEKKLTDYTPDEIRKLIEQSNEQENELKKAIEESTPFISELTVVEILREEYRDHKFENCFDELKAKYSHVRRLRRDGNCFYRAFLF